MKGFEKGDKVLHNGRVMTVESVSRAEDSGEWQDTLVVTDGHDSVKTGEFDCVFAMPDSGDESARLYKYLQKNGVYGEVFLSHTRAEILIEWGDWKHDHGFADYLMGLVGYIRIGETVTDEDGSDCYSSLHTYLRPAFAA